MEEGEGMFDLISISEAIKQSYASKGLLVVGGIMFYKGYLEKEKNDLWTMVRTS